MSFKISDCKFLLRTECADTCSYDTVMHSLITFHMPWVTIGQLEKNFAVLFFVDTKIPFDLQISQMSDDFQYSL